MNNKRKMKKKKKGTPAEFPPQSPGTGRRCVCGCM
jgi:hypothetical protein